MIVNKSDDAVSPVIGIMLMLVVTIVIAAVVAAVATGMMTETEPAPIAQLDVNIYSSYDAYVTEGMVVHAPTMHITHLSGDSLNTKDLKLTFSWVCPEGDSHFSQYEYDDSGRWGTYSQTAGSNFIFRENSGAAKPSGYTGSTIQPLCINYGNDGGAFFGSAILKRGQTLLAYELHLLANTPNEGNPAMDVLFNNGEVIARTPDTGIPCTYDTCSGSLQFYEDGKEIPEMGMMMDPGWYCTNIDCTNSYCPVEIDDSDSEESVGSASGIEAGIMECLPQGTVVEVTIIHKPSSKPIYNEKVYVQ